MIISIIGEPKIRAGVQKLLSLEQLQPSLRKIVSLRTPDLMFKHAEGHVAVASRSLSLVLVALLTARYGCCQNSPSVIGVPVKSRALSGVDSLSIVQMPGGYQSQPWRSLKADCTPSVSSQ